MKILSIHSAVAYGRVGNSALTIPLAAIGCELVALNTTRLAHHPGHGAWCGRMEDASLLTEMVAGLDGLGVLGRIDGMLSGYLGEPDKADTVLEARRRIDAARPWLCDPVIGDADSGIYVRPGIVETIRDRLIPGADIVTPNHFELGVLTGREATTLGEIADSARDLIARGPGIVAVTSAPSETARTGVLLVSRAHAVLMTTPVVPVEVKGTGDLFSGLLLAGIAGGSTAEEACASAIARIYTALRRTEIMQAEELVVLEPAATPIADMSAVEIREV